MATFSQKPAEVVKKWVLIDAEGLVVNIAVGYGGRQEIADAVRELLRERLPGVFAAVPTAKEQGVPAYVVFHDATLRAIATAAPTTIDELGRLSGVGAAKLDRYGPAVLEVIAAHTG